MRLNRKDKDTRPCAIWVTSKTELMNVFNILKGLVNKNYRCPALFRPNPFAAQSHSPLCSFALNGFWLEDSRPRLTFILKHPLRCGVSADGYLGAVAVAACQDIDARIGCGMVDVVVALCAECIHFCTCRSVKLERYTVAVGCRD